ncbi:macrophage mannose receptor 1-like protein [Leptotrombidium deliense]|uniref:Macrophage mannose receptor 1-like protein n=1 Tax=Leptotrombidium deliense TaxID=299467 RepID=A0A443S2D6_9ACAR|nr:macrophage mannose receptor 1-like protein [Leptotrombidium deliense]
MVERNYFDMKRYCESIDASLFTIHSQAENDFLLKSIVSYSTYLGVKKKGNQWKWNDGKLHSFEHWSDGEPNDFGGIKDCVMFYKMQNGVWFAAACNMTMHTVCKPNNCETFVKQEKDRENVWLKNYIESKVNEAKIAIISKIMSGKRESNEVETYFPELKLSPEHKIVMLY